MSNALSGGASSNGHDSSNGLVRKGSSSGAGSVAGTPRSRRAAGRTAVGLSNGHHVIDRLNGSSGDFDVLKGEDGEVALSVAEEQYSSANFKPLYEGSTIDRREFLRLTLQSLRDLGLTSSAQALERETRMTLEHPSISAFRKAVIGGEWKHVERLLMEGLTSAAKRQAARQEGGGTNGFVNTNGSSSKAPPSVDTVLRDPETHNIDWIKFLLHQQRYLELLEAKRTKKALSVLRERITPLEHGSERLHQLSSLVMCTTPDELRRRANWSGTLGGSRQTLLDEIERVVQPNIMIPSRRLPELLEQAQEWQRQQDPYSNAPSRGLFSLYADHASDRSSFPTYSSDADVLDAHTDEVWQLAFSADGRRLVTAGKDRRICIWKVPADIDEGKPITLEKKLMHSDTVRCIAWSPDGRSLLTASENDVTLWNVETGHSETIVEGIYLGGTVAWLLDGKSFVVGGMSGDLSIWNLDCIRLHSWKINRVVALAVSPDGKRLVVVDWRAMPTYPATGRPSSSSRSRAAAYPTSGGSSQAASSFGGSFNPLSPRNWAYGRLADGDGSAAVAPSTMKHPVAVDLGGGSRTLTNEQQAIHFFDLPSRKEIGCVYMPDRLVSVSITSDSRYVLLNKRPNESQLWDIEAQCLVSKYVGHPIEENLIHACLGGAREQFIVSGSEDGHIYIYHRATRKLLERLQGHEPCTVNSVAWHPTQPALFASCSDDHTVRIWRPAPGSGANVVRARRREVRSDAVPPHENGSNGNGAGGETAVSSPSGPNPFPWTASPTHPTSDLSSAGIAPIVDEDEEIGEGDEDDAQGEYDEDDEEDSEDEDVDDEDEDRMEEA